MKCLIATLEAVLNKRHKDVIFLFPAVEESTDVGMVANPRSSQRKILWTFEFHVLS
jgi:hypothetical protein